MMTHEVTRLRVAALWPARLLLAGCGGGGPRGGGGKLTDDKIVLGVLNDQSGVYADLSGQELASRP